MTWGGRGVWNQIHDPLGNAALPSVAAAILEVALPALIASE
jgi:hypothetical protein